MLSKYIELCVVVGIEAVLLLGVAVPIWAKNVDHFPNAEDSHRHPNHGAAIRLERPLSPARTANSAGRT